MEKDWLRNVPIEIKNELEELGLRIGSLWGGEETPCAVCTNHFIQKENKEVIKRLKELGWNKHEGHITNGVKYVTFEKHF